MVSVIIPCYNNSFWLDACLQSCITQGSLLKEIIIVDDGSIDGSYKILEKWRVKHPDKISLYKNPLKGANHARNFGFEKSTGDFIQWLDADDALLPDKFENQVIPLKKGEADIVYSDWRMDFWEQNLKVDSKEKTYQNYPDFLEELIKDNWTSPNNYLMTREIADKLKGGIGWNPETMVGQDREYFTMAGILGARFIYVQGLYAVYNKQSQGTISSMDFNKRLELNQSLEEKLRHYIQNQTWISTMSKKRYLRILDTHKLKACFYNQQIELNRPINFFGIRWDIVHWKMRFVIPLVYIKKHIQLIFKYIIKK